MERQTNARSSIEVAKVVDLEQRERRNETGQCPAARHERFGSRHFQATHSKREDDRQEAVQCDH